jgi:hypothetical protein
MLVEHVRQGLRAWERIRYWPRPVLGNAAGNAWIAQLFRSRTPCAIAKLGSVELAAIRVGASGRGRDGVCRIWGRRGEDLHVNAGVFPPTPEEFTRACDTMVEALHDLDGVGVWYNRGEAAMLRRQAPHATCVAMRALEPYYHQTPWSAALAGRRVVVLSPFAASIERQYAQREGLWTQHDAVLPAFTLSTVRVPLSAALAPPAFPDWHASLTDLTARMLASGADVALIGAGAWSIPLAARAKRAGMQAIHLGGATQLLFGIRGRRWDDHPEISRFFTPAWSRPAVDERPPEVARVEGGCYW